jgi:L-2-hydroxyglutarate oxidase LhgO
LQQEFDVVIGGGGIIGLSMAMSLIKIHPDLKIAIVEKEESVGQHASGRNSGVLHAGFTTARNH